MNGVLHFYSETGTEGGHWAFQDDKFIHPDGQWDYDGLHVLEDGDRLTIYDKSSKVVWHGAISLRYCSIFSEVTSQGYWKHSDQNGVDPLLWEEWFFGYFHATLEKKK